jgi:Ferritin-like
MSSRTSEHASEHAPREPEIVIRHREELAYLLTEAAEIEHGLMCCYLFAAHSLKRGEVDGLTGDEAAAVARWRAAIVDVAIDEMLHLALVSNLLAAIGSSPHFERPNFPVAPGYHPAGIVVSLAPFDLPTMNHFVFLERPEGVEVPDGHGFDAPGAYVRSALTDRLVPSAQDYATVGHLYRGIRAGLVALAGRLGPDRLFVGSPDAQVGPDLAPLDALVAVTDLASALRAVDTIVEQGEGSPSDHEHSHYRRLSRVRDELAARLADNPGFSPAHPVARNPVMRKPPEPAGKVHIDDPQAARVVDFGNAVYAFALRCLGRAFGEADDPKSSRRVLVEASLTAMRDLAPIMDLLARMPASPLWPGTHAGLTFTTQRFGVGFSQQRAAWTLLAERAVEIARAGERLAREVDGSLDRVSADFASLASGLERAAPRTGRVDVSAGEGEAAAPRFIMVLVDEHDAIPQGCCLRFKVVGEPRAVRRVHHERDDGSSPAGIWTVDSPGDGGAHPAWAVTVEDSGAGTSVLVYGGSLGLRLHIEGGGDVIAEPYLLLSPEAIVEDDPENGPS